MTLQYIRKHIRTFSGHFWSITSLTIFSIFLVVVFCIGVSAMVIQHTLTTRTNNAYIADTSDVQPTQNTNISSIAPVTTPPVSTPPSQSPTTQSTPAKSPSASTPSQSPAPVSKCDVEPTWKGTFVTGNGYVTSSLSSMIKTETDWYTKGWHTEAEAVNNINQYASNKNITYTNNYNDYMNEINQNGCTSTVSGPLHASSCSTISECQTITP